MSQKEEDAATVDSVTAICKGISVACKGQKSNEVYAALVYCLGRCISMANDPADMLCMTIQRLAIAANITCRSLSDLDELEEALNDDSDAVSTH